MVTTVFRSRLRSENAVEFQTLADEMLALAREMPGFLSYKLFTAEDGERTSITEWASPEHLQAWREHGRHVEVMKIGREKYYAEYTLQVIEKARESRFVAER